MGAGQKLSHSYFLISVQPDNDLHLALLSQNGYLSQRDYPRGASSERLAISLVDFLNHYVAIIRLCRCIPTAPSIYLTRSVARQSLSCRELGRSYSSRDYTLFNDYTFLRRWIKGVAVDCHQSSFSRQRLVIAAANALAYAWQVPALAVNGEINYKLLQNKFGKLRHGSLIKITYSRPAVGY